MKPDFEILEKQMEQCLLSIIDGGYAGNTVDKRERTFRFFLNFIREENLPETDWFEPATLDAFRIH